jgi:hypothetical protein
VRVEQYVYFSAASDTMSAAEITDAVGLSPDEVMVRGSRLEDPPSPTSHSWKLVCRDAGLRVDQQIEIVLGRVEPHADALGVLAGLVDGDQQPVVRNTLQVVRFFGESAGDAGTLGWHLGAGHMQLLARLGAEVDADEYG